MRVLIVGEGKHELGTAEQPGALCALVRRLLPRAAEFAMERISSPRVRIHRLPGKGGNLGKRILAWCRLAAQEGFDALVLILDEDGDPTRQPEVDRAQEDQRIALPRAVGLAIRTFDAWILADEQALSRVLGCAIQRLPDPETVRDPKSVCAQLNGRGTNPHSAADLYREVLNVADLELLSRRCPQGFAPFAARVRAL